LKGIIQKEKDVDFESDVNVAVERKRSVGAGHASAWRSVMEKKYWRIAAEKRHCNKSIGCWTR
jgi:hypothetical protein